MKIIVPISGGKDSTATLLLALETRNEEIIPLHNHTGWDHPITYDYLNYLEKQLGVKIQYTTYEEAPDIPSLIRRLRRFPWGTGRFCTAKLKQTAIYRWYKEHGYYDSAKGECWFGIRSDESRQRAKKYGGLSPDALHDYGSIYTGVAKALNKNVKLRFPILDWNTEQTFEYLKERGIEPNPLYAEGTNDRVGCYPCLLAGKAVQKRMFETEVGQERLKIIRQLETEIGEAYKMYDTDQGSCEVCKT